MLLDDTTGTSSSSHEHKNAEASIERTWAAARDVLDVCGICCGR
jgi:hypothetical protein